MLQTALNAITRSLSVDLKSDGIFAVALHPGWVQTDMGGPDAQVSTATSVQGLLKVIAGVTEETTGSFLSYEGTVVQW